MQDGDFFVANKMPSFAFIYMFLFCSLLFPLLCSSLQFSTCRPCILSIAATLITVAATANINNEKFKAIKGQRVENNSYNNKKMSTARKRESKQKAKRQLQTNLRIFTYASLSVACTRAVR